MITRTHDFKGFSVKVSVFAGDCTKYEVFERPCLLQHLLQSCWRNRKHC